MSDKPKIEAIYAYIIPMVGDDEYGERLCTLADDGDSWMGMLSTDIDRHTRLRDYAQRLANKFGKPVKAVKFSLREEMETILPVEEKP